MPELRPDHCPISGDTEARLVFAYDSPPAGEVGFRRPDGALYYREVWQFERSRHFVSRHAMDVATSYDSEYVDASYGGRDGMVAAFDRVISLRPELSDNAGRLARVRTFAETHLGRSKPITLLDVGAGLGVFPHAVKEAGWQCTAIDPDQRAAEHIRNRVGVPAICSEFTQVGDIGRFDIVTLNKVLEHVADPVGMLRAVHGHLAKNGFVYVEVPDGEAAATEGRGREEFFVEHLHVFSFASTVMMANRAGFSPVIVERLREPSTKFTLRAFLMPDRRPV